MTSRGIFDSTGWDPSVGVPAGTAPRAIFDSGAIWYTGSGAPSGGANGQIYLNIDNGDVYRNSAGTWVLIVNLRGPPGLPGLPGGPGLNGAPGAVWYTGSGAPSVGLGITGDFYLRSDTSGIYAKLAGAWVFQFTLSGGGGGGGDMFKADNLSGLANYTTARSNLGLGTLATQNGTFSGTSSGTNTGDQDLSALAPLASPHLTGVPLAPTASAGTNTTQIATTAYADAIAALKANLASPALTGSPTAPTQTAGDNSTKIATTNYIDRLAGAANGLAQLDGSGLVPVAQLPAIAITDVFPVASQAAMLALTAQKGDIAIRSDLNKSFALSTNSPGTLADWLELLSPTAAVSSVAGRTGAVVLAIADITGGAPLASPTLTGVPLAPTASPATNTTQIATTAYADAIAALKANLASPTFTGTPAAPTATAGTNTTQLATTAFVTTADNLKANLASPTLTGTPLAPTAAGGTNTTQIATTAFVATSFAPLASPTLTGNPIAPTQTPGTNNTRIATTAYADAIAALKANLASPSFTGVVTIVDLAETPNIIAAAASASPVLTSGRNIKVTTNANFTLTLPAAVAGKAYVIEVAYGGAHTLTFAGGTSLQWNGGVAPTATSVNAKSDFFVFYCNPAGTRTIGAILAQNVTT